MSNQSNIMKLRKIGNSLGTTFSKEVLQNAGITADDELQVVATPGEIRLRSADGRLTLELTKVEADALAEGKMTSKAGLSVVAKVRKLVEREDVTK